MINLPAIRRGGVALLLLLLGVFAAGVEGQDCQSIRTQSFDRDPGWEGLNNRLLPEILPSITQDFGYSETSYTSAQKGEVGGTIFRSMTPSYYAARIDEKTLDEPLTASGSFAVTASQGSAGAFFGWFNSVQPTGSGRPVSSLGLNLDFESGGGRLAVRLISAGNQTCGTFITKYERNDRPTPIRNDGTRYHWTLEYDPAANGNGQFTFVITSDSEAPQDFEGKRFTVDLPPEVRKDGAAFDRFGLLSMTKPGNALTLYFGNLRHDGVAENLAAERSHWIESASRATAVHPPVGAHDFGYSPDTNHAGGARGEIGGDLWRSGKYAYYADRIGPLSLEDRLEASGEVVLEVGAPDSDIFLGWFSSAPQETPPAESGNFLGVHIGGPTRIGHYFKPQLATAKGTQARVDAGPVLRPQKVFAWSMVYDPGGGGGDGELRITLGEETVALTLKKGVKAEGARFDRFGLFNSTAGGQLVRIHLDDLKYTASADRPAARNQLGGQ